MKNSTLQFAFVFFAMLQISCSSPLKKCTITGRVIGRSSNSLILITVLEDPRFAKIHIPINDSTFTYEIDATVQVKLTGLFLRTIPFHKGV